MSLDLSIDLGMVAAAAFFAGVVDAIVGGGGLITVPALFTTYPNLSPALLLGTNKCSSVFGTSVAACNYARRVTLDWRWLLPATVAAFAGALLGAWTLTQMDPRLLRQLLPGILCAVLVYTLCNPRLGLTHAPRQNVRHTLLITLGVGAVIGWYDGFFGPGTGSFFIFLLVRLVGLDFLHASAYAKVLNVATNLAALLLLASVGQVWWLAGLLMAAANVAGSLCGTHLAIRHGAGLVRKLFILVVLALIIKTGWPLMFGT